MAVNPLIVAVNHPTNIVGEASLEQEYDKVIKMFASISGKKSRRVFIEISPKGLQELKSSGWARVPDPFLAAYFSARTAGYEIIPLDNNKLHDIDSLGNYSRILRNLGEADAPKLFRYLNKNLREKYWAFKVKANKITSADVIVMHPNHVRGFLKESGLKPKFIRWINKPQKLMVLQRLRKGEVAKLKRILLQKRKQRASISRHNKISKVQH